MHTKKFTLKTRTVISKIAVILLGASLLLQDVVVYAAETGECYTSTSEQIAPVTENDPGDPADEFDPAGPGEVTKPGEAADPADGPDEPAEIGDQSDPSDPGDTDEIPGSADPSDPGDTDDSDEVTGPDDETGADETEDPDDPDETADPEDASADGEGEDNDLIVDDLADGTTDPHADGTVSADEIVISGVKAFYEYTGAPVKPEPVVTVGDPSDDSSTVLILNTDYVISYKNNTEVSADTVSSNVVEDGRLVKKIVAAHKSSAKTPTITIRFIGNYSGVKTLTFEIVPLGSTEPINLSNPDKAFSAPIYTVYPEDDPAALFIKPQIIYGAAKLDISTGDEGFLWYKGTPVADAEINSSLLINAAEDFATIMADKQTYTYTVRVYAYPNQSTYTENSFIDTPITVTKTGVMYMNRACVSYPKNSCEYLGGAEVKPAFTVRYNGIVLKEYVDDVTPYNYKVSYTDNRAIGTASATFTGSGMTCNGITLAGTKTVAFRITGKYSITADLVTVAEEVDYDPTGMKPAVTVEAPEEYHALFPEKTMLIPNVDYALTYGSDREGTYVIVRGKGDFTVTGGPIKKYYNLNEMTVNKCSLNDLIVTASDVPYTEQVSGYQNTVLSFCDSSYNVRRLKSGTDYQIDKYEIRYNSAQGLDWIRLANTTPVPAGNVIRITISGIGNYEGTATAVYSITDASGQTSDAGSRNISSVAAVVNGGQPCRYTGEEICPGQSNTDPSFTLTYHKGSADESVLVKGRDYEIAGYFNNVNSGSSAFVFVRGLGTYTGTMSVRFTIAAPGGSDAQIVIDNPGGGVDRGNYINASDMDLDAVRTLFNSNYALSAVGGDWGYLHQRMIPYIANAIPDDGEDDTKAINVAILWAYINSKINEDPARTETDLPTIVYLPAGTYDITPGWINGDRGKDVGIVMWSNVSLIMDTRTILKVKAADFGSSHNNGEYAVICASEKENFTIEGGEIAGERNVHNPSNPYDPKEFGHGIAIYTCNNVNIIGMKIHDNWGDGIYLGQQDNEVLNTPEAIDKARNHRIKIMYCSIYKNRRDNISIISGKQINIEYCDIWDAGDTDPCCGINLEPNTFYLMESPGVHALKKDENGNILYTEKDGSSGEYVPIYDYTRGFLEDIVISNTTIKSKRKNDGSFMAIRNLEGTRENKGLIGKGFTIIGCDIDGDVGCYSMTDTLIQDTRIRGTLFYRSQKTACTALIDSPGDDENPPVRLSPVIIDCTIEHSNQVGWYLGYYHPDNKSNKHYYIKDSNGRYKQINIMYFNT